MATTRTKVEREVSAKACDLCHTVYSRASEPGSAIPDATGEGRFRIMGGIQAWNSETGVTRPAVRQRELEMCPDCAAVVWDMIQEQVQPNPNAPPPVQPRVSVYREPTRLEQFRAIVHAPRCGRVILNAVGDQPRVTCNQRSLHEGLCDPGARVELKQFTAEEINRFLDTDRDGESEEAE